MTPKTIIREAQANGMIPSFSSVGVNINGEEANPARPRRYKCEVAWRDSR